MCTDGDWGNQMKTTFKCAECGQIHDLSQAALVFQMPRQVAQLRRELSQAEFQRRVRVSQDLCNIDQKFFFIRGVLSVPIPELGSSFDWGLWSLVDPKDFQHYVDLWDADIDDDEPPFEGWLAGSPPEYPEADMTEIAVHMQSNGKRPYFEIIDPNQKLAIAQRDGITLAQVHKFIANVTR